MPKMKFKEDKIYRGEILYKKNQVYDIEDKKVSKWLKRGGKVVDGSEGMNSSTDVHPSEHEEHHDDSHLEGEEMEDSNESHEEGSAPKKRRKKKKS